MTWTYAGEWAGDVIYRTQGAAANLAVTITTSADEAAALYTDATKGTPLGGNVATTDSLGNLAFFADPGTYTCTAGASSFTAVVAVNPLEPESGQSGATGTSAFPLTVTDSSGALWSTAASTAGALSLLPIMQDLAYDAVLDQSGGVME